MKEKTRLGIGYTIIGMILLGITWKLSNVKISSSIAHHPELDARILVKSIKDREEPDLLLEDKVISGQVQLMIEVDPESEAYTYVEYKINGFNYAPGYLPSYDVLIDTKELSDGWNQVLAIGYNSEGNVVGVKNDHKAA